MGKNRSGISSLLNSKGQLRKAKGKPRIEIGIEFVVYTKLLQISKGRKITMWKAWHQLCKHRNFADLMKPHFQKMKKYKGSTAWRKLIKDSEWQNEYYKNNVIKSQLTKRLSKIDFTY